MDIKEGTIRIEFTGTQEFLSKVDKDYMKHGKGQSLSKFISKYYDCGCTVKMSTSQEDDAEDYDIYTAIFTDKEKAKKFQKRLSKKK